MGRKKMQCRFCGTVSTMEDGDFQPDPNGRGFWCEVCDGFTYYDHIKDRHRFILILEEKATASVSSIKTNKKFNKRLSPYRYPGGKSKIIDYLYLHLQESKTGKLISPFTGGGSFELAMLDAGVVQSLHLNDLDFGVFSFWYMVKHAPFAMIEKIRSIVPTHEDFFNAQELIKADYRNVDMVDAAWASLLVNRLAYSGIYKANPIGGKHGSQEKLLCRWKPDELIRRIERIHKLSDRIEVTNENAVDLIEETYWLDDATIFIDPPYVKKGKDLYPCHYDEQDHVDLAVLLDSLYHGCPGADIIVTYDYNDWLYNLYLYPEVKKIERRYSA
ncbi:DNA adenine methylase [Caldibacillus debilis]|nr:DNA adenine methylase [Caldibacillus debilis]